MRGRLISRRESYETLILPPVHIPKGFVKGWATLTQKEVVKDLPCSWGICCVWSQISRNNGLLVGSHWKSGCWQRRITSRK